MFSPSEYQSQPTVWWGLECQSSWSWFESRYDDKTKPTLKRRLGICKMSRRRGGLDTAVEATVPKNWPNVAKSDHFGPNFGHLGNFKKVFRHNITKLRFFNLDLTQELKIK